MSDSPAMRRALLEREAQLPPEYADQTCDACGGDERTCDMRPACPYCGTSYCTVCVNEHGDCCGGNREDGEDD